MFVQQRDSILLLRLSAPAPAQCRSRTTVSAKQVTTNPTSKRAAEILQVRHVALRRAGRCDGPNSQHAISRQAAPKLPIAGQRGEAFPNEFPLLPSLPTFPSFRTSQQTSIPKPRHAFENGQLSFQHVGQAGCYIFFACAPGGQAKE